MTLFTYTWIKMYITKFNLNNPFYVMKTKMAQTCLQKGNRVITDKEPS